jgi:hypothetical protein
VAFVEFQARYGGELADHLPMARMALHRMGAAPLRIEAFTQQYVADKKLQPLADAPGEAGARDAICAEMRRDGRDAVLRRKLRELMPGVGAGAFHPLIRLAYAVEAGDDREVAAAFVYWRDAYLDLGFDTDDSAAPFHPEVAFARLRSDLAGVALPKGIIFTRMSAAVADPRFAVAVRAGGLPHDEGDLKSVARFVVTWFAATRGFVALHAMTAVHAFRVVGSYLDVAQALPALWWALCAAYAAAALPEIGETSTLAAPPWEAVLAAAVASDDEHDIKAAYTAWSEERAYGGELYRLAAAHYLRLAV